MNMQYVYAAATAALVVTMALALILLIALSGYLFGRPEWLDLAITYVLINFVGTLAVLRFSKYGSVARRPEVEPE